jgi:hypothetical protein
VPKSINKSQIVRKRSRGFVGLDVPDRDDRAERFKTGRGQALGSNKGG